MHHQFAVPVNYEGSVPKFKVPPFFSVGVFLPDPGVFVPDPILAFIHRILRFRVLLASTRFDDSLRTFGVVDARTNGR